MKHSEYLFITVYHLQGNRNASGMFGHRNHPRYFFIMYLKRTVRNLFVFMTFTQKRISIDCCMSFIRKCHC